jgi:hypothetical protein
MEVFTLLKQKQADKALTLSFPNVSHIDISLE